MLPGRESDHLETEAAHIVPCVMPDAHELALWLTKTIEVAQYARGVGQAREQP